MQAVVVYGRAVARVVLSGLYNEVSPWPATNSSVGSAHCSTTVTVNSTAQGLSPSELHLITASSGFSKSHTPAQLTKKWSFGDDACFIAGHKLADVIGVADGVGGWREYGVDPSQFPKSLMETCGRLVKEGHFVPEEPVGIIARSYTELLDNKAPLVGSCTACIVSLHRQEKKVHTANLGDSGFRVIRCGKVVHRSEEQQHYFNSPYQLSVAPSEYQGLVFSDSPESAQSSSFEVEAGDVILVGTDGLFDNMTDSMILDYISKLEGSDIENVQSIANGIVKEAQKLAFDANYLSPFAKSAASNGLVFKGGKPDDITVMLAKVTERAADVDEPT